MLWFTSDFHFCHDREFIYIPRGFSSINEMNETLVRNYNQLVAKYDEVYILGDIMLNDNNMGLQLFNQLNGKIHIIRGNHDTNTRIELYKSCPNVVEISEGKHINYNGYHFFLCHYPTLTANYTDEKKLKSRLLNICGHTHTKDRFCDMDKGIIYHVEVDAHNCYPVNIEQIIDEIKEEYSKRCGGNQ